MPYIEKRIRKILDEQNKGVAFNSGQLNYIITKILISYFGTLRTYAQFNDAIGVLECAKLELYRRMIAPYEDQKRRKNGEVYPK